MYMCSIDNHSYGNNFTITVKMGNMMHTKTKQNKSNNKSAITDDHNTTDVKNYNISPNHTHTHTHTHQYQ